MMAAGFGLLSRNPAGGLHHGKTFGDHVETRRAPYIGVATAAERLRHRSFWAWL